MPFLGVAAGISGVASLVSGFLGKDAANQAAQLQAKAAQQGIDALTDSEKQVLAQFQATQGQVQANLQPYLTAGTGALSQLSTDLQPGGSLNTPFTAPAGAPSPTFNAPTGVDLANDPGYQFRLQQGIKALQNSQSATGSVLSGAGIKGLNDWVQNDASNEYQNVYNRAQSTFGANQTGYQNLFNNSLNAYGTNTNGLYSRLSGLTSTGLTGATNLTGAETSLANSAANTQTGTAAGVAGLITGSGAAQAAGVVGGTNALTGALGNIGSTAQQLSLYNLLYKPPASSAGGTGLVPDDGGS